jgi:hypothetical protein
VPADSKDVSALPLWLHNRLFLLVNEYINGSLYYMVHYNWFVRNSKYAFSMESWWFRHEGGEQILWFVHLPLDLDLFCAPPTWPGSTGVADPRGLKWSADHAPISNIHVQSRVQPKHAD